jgi:hypothetical protein
MTQKADNNPYVRLYGGGRFIPATKLYAPVASKRSLFDQSWKPKR